MSRIGRMPVVIPAGVTVTIGEDNLVTVKGPRGTLTEKFSPRMKLEVEAGVLHVTRPTDEKEDRSLHGLTRALVHNMVVGVTDGFQKTLEINGTGYRATIRAKTCCSTSVTLLSTVCPRRHLPLHSPKASPSR